MKIYRHRYMAEAFKKILYDLYYNPEYITKPRDMEVREILNCIVEIEEPNFNLYKNKVRSSPEKYIAGEYLWYFSGTNKPNWIEANFVGAGEMWKKLHNLDGTVNSAYGYLIFNELTPNEDMYTQYQWVIESLKKDKDSRQAFMHFNKPRHQFKNNKDQVCTMTALFHIRDNKLHMTLTMRSNDVIFGFMTDFAFFNMLHQQVFVHLKKYYPEIEMGTYTHTSHSMHLYADKYDLVKEMLEHPFFPAATPELKTSIIDEYGKFHREYYDIFEAIVDNTYFSYKEYDNEVIDWCLKKLT